MMNSSSVTTPPSVDTITSSLSVGELKTIVARWGCQAHKEDMKNTIGTSFDYDKEEEIVGGVGLGLGLGEEEVTDSEENKVRV